MLEFSQKVTTEVLSISLYNGMTEGEVNYTIEKINEF